MEERIRKGRRGQPSLAWLKDRGQVMQVLETGEMELQGMIPWSSNYTYLARVSSGDRELLGVYKPACGERPLWDFDTGTLCNREVAAYLLSREIGWPSIPPTVLRDGPMGIGAVQQFIEFKRRENFFTMRDRCPEDMQKIAVFDAIINNTDRKGGHILMDEAGAIWCIDHGVTFHEEPKLRTVVWDFIGEPIPGPLVMDLEGIRRKLKPGEQLRNELEPLLSRSELRALDARLGRLLRDPVFPSPPEDWPHIPWPPV